MAHNPLRRRPTGQPQPVDEPGYGAGGGEGPAAGRGRRRVSVWTAVVPVAAAVAGLLLIDRPPGFDGHYGGVSADFGIQFGDCIYRFAIAQPASCGPATQIYTR